MTTLKLPSPASAAGAAERPTIWGLSARELHDAYWHSRGVQCIRRGSPQTLQRGAELHLLIEPGQLVLFDVQEIAERLAWRKATVTCLRILDQEDRAYDEHVVLDADGLVERIERRYGPRTRRYCRALLTSSSRLARAWMDASDARQGRRMITRALPWSCVDHLRVCGRRLDEDTDGDDGQLVRALAECWENPDESIEGIWKCADGVWAMAGERIPEDAIVLGPAWIGTRAGTPRGAVIIGPAWAADGIGGAGHGTSRARVREISEIELDRPRNAGGARRQPGAHSVYGTAKRLFDLVVSSLVLTTCMPLFGLIAIAILLEDGRPVLYGHVRQSRGGRLFRCWKFRTMYRDAERRKMEFRDRNQSDGPHVYMRHDPRVTRVGRILRTTQLDEFPQFWNVLRGHMSVVGPRPSPDDENQYCPAWRELRLSVRPGITGLWQIRRTRAPGRDFQEWIRYDIEYVRRAGFFFDLGICLRTAWVVLLRKRA